MGRRLLGALCIGTLIVGLMSGRAQADVPLPDQAVAFDRQVRAKYPYHIQGVAISARMADNSRVLVVPEPPPDASVAGIANASGLDGAQAGVQRWTIGNDGWVADVVISTPAAITDVQYREAISRLHKYMFGTSYKAYALDLKGSLPPAKDRHLNVSVTAAELNAWLLDAKEPFVPVDGGRALDLPEIMRAGEFGVYFNTGRGLVAWVLPTGKDIRPYRPEARQFALDSDLVVGAVCANGCVAIIGRERQADVATLPPLRAETMVLLASVPIDELKQSYERTSAFAGRIRTVKDAAPIYLSPELIDTEFGSLLNLADQLLKSWSEHGNVLYDGFTYPKPEQYPFDLPLSRILKGKTLLFNWNTIGVGYTLTTLHGGVYALNRSGSLPVIYRPDHVMPEGAEGDRVRQAEERGYSGFAKANDPLLVRVVQYTSLYQAFHRFGVTAQPMNPPNNAGQRRVLADAALKLLRSLRDATAEDIDAALTRYKDVFSAAGLPAAKWDEALPIYRTILESTQAQLKTMTGPALDRLATSIASRGAPKSLQTSFRIWGDLDQVLKDYSTAAEPRTVQTWIHTGSVVISQDIGPGGAATIGGHNLKAQVTDFLVDPTVPKGVARADTVNGKVVFSCNPDDAARVQTSLRELAGKQGAPDELAADLTRILNAEKPLPIRDRVTAMELPDGSRIEGRGFASNEDGFGSGRRGWSGGGGTPPAAHDPPPPPNGDPFRRFGPPAIVVECIADGSYSIVYKRMRMGVQEAATFEAWTTADAADVLDQIHRKHPTGDDPIELFIIGANEKESRNLTATMEARGKVRSHVTVELNKDVSGEEAATILTRNYDWSKARLELEPPVATAEGGSKAVFRVQLPSSNPGEARASLRIEAVTREPANAGVFARLKERLLNVLSMLTGRPRLNQVNLMLLRDAEDFFQLEKLPANVQIIIGTEKADFTISTTEQFDERRHDAGEGVGHASATGAA